jgi:hypothetical protein
MDHLRAGNRRPVLVGTWAAATWAIRFYQHNGFRLVPEHGQGQAVAGVLEHSREAGRGVGRAGRGKLLK